MRFKESDTLDRTAGHALLAQGVPVQLTRDAKTYSKFDVETAVAKYRSDLDALLTSLKARILPYLTVSHEDLTSWAPAANQAFVPSESETKKGDETTTHQIQ